MRTHKTTKKEAETLQFVYSGLAKISEAGRKRLKDAVQTLLLIQNPPDYPLSDGKARTSERRHKKASPREEMTVRREQRFID